MNVHQRAKVEDYGGHLFIVARTARMNARVETKQISLFLGRDFVLTFLEDPGDCFESLRARLRSNQGRLRAAGAAYLACSLLDAIVDSYFPLIESFGDRLRA